MLDDIQEFFTDIWYGKTAEMCLVVSNAQYTRALDLAQDMRKDFDFPICVDIADALSGDDGEMIQISDNELHVLSIKAGSFFKKPSVDHDIFTYNVE